MQACAAGSMAAVPTSDKSSRICFRLIDVTKLTAGITLFALAVAGAICASAAELKPWTGGATPELVLRDLKGATVNLADYRGKVVLVNFWATWCEPCRDEMPSMQELKRKLGGRPFEIIAVNLAESEAKVADFLRRFPVDFTILLDRSSEVRREWKVKMLPTSFVVAPDGSLRYAVVGEMNWADQYATLGLTRLVPKN
jgi:cytochrome c biogenesis protein CcmG, thiol:disulfide interchange protein DsbE